MNATACTLAALLMFEAAASPPPTEDCSLTDNRCKAGLYERRAAAAPNPAQRAQYLYTAYRSYLFLFEKTGDLRDLCAARRTLDASIAVAGQPQAQRTLSENMRVDLVSREHQKDAHCGSVAKQRRVKKTEAPLVARRAAPEPPADLLPGPPAPSAQPPQAADPAAVTTSPPTVETTTTKLRLLSIMEESPLAKPPESAGAALMPVAARHVTVERPRSDPRPGRGLVIASGATLGVGVALTAAAGYMGSRLSQKRQEVFTLHAMLDGYPTEEQAATGKALTREHDAMRSQTVALAMAGGATLVIAVVLASVGARRMARVASRTALIPAPGGLVFHARF
jgi:hypothetical protein